MSTASAFEKLIAWLTTPTATGPVAKADNAADLAEIRLLRQAETEALVEEFKVRWQELISLQNEGNRWSLLYLSAVLISIGWFLGNPNYATMAALFAGHAGADAYLIMLLAVLNSFFTLALVARGWWIHQIGFYCYHVLGRDVRQFTQSRFAIWDGWRRTQFSPVAGKGTVDQLRGISNVVTGILPIIVSLIILGAAYKWGPADPSWRWLLAFWGSAIINFAVLGYAAWSTVVIEKLWRTVVQEDFPS
jgi:hypothetical protein